MKTVLADLYKEERLHDDIFDKARKIIRLPPEKITGQLKDYDQLLDQLHDQSINPLDFVKAWYSLGVKVAGGAAAAQVKPELPEEPFPDAISTKKVATEKPSKEKATPVPSLKPQHSKAPWIIAAIICVLLAAIIFSWEQKTEPVLESVQQEPPKKITNSLGMTFVYIPPGTFTMGSPETEPGRNDNEKQQPVTLTQGFYLQTTEVTQEQWRAVMEENPAHFKACGDNCPVENVSWDDVQRFIKKLNGMSDGNTYRLPTEAEWEYAARAGSKTAFANGGIAELKCGHDPNLDAMGWYCSNSSVNYEGCFDASSYRGHKCAGTHPVGQKRLNDWGIYDMHGNVWEWCQDWYTKSPKGGTDPTGPPEGESRVIRGGSWNGPAGSCRAAYRGRGEPGFRFIGIGFRLALPPGQPK